MSHISHVAKALLRSFVVFCIVMLFGNGMTRAVSATALQGDYMVDDVAWAWPCRQMRGWAGLLALECRPGCFAALYAPVGVTLDGG